MKLEQWRENSSAQKKTWITLGTVGFVLALLWLPSANDIKQFLTIRPHADVPRQVLAEKPSPAIAAAPVTTVAPPVPAPAPVAPSGAAFLGRWAGAALLPPRHGICKLTVEIGANPDGTSSGYSTLACQPPASDYMRGRGTAPNAMRLAMSINPASAILTGTTDEAGVLHFKVTKNIGVAEANHGCNMTSADATPFGAGHVAFEWHEEGCPGGQILMTHAK